MRRIFLLLASIALAVIFGSGVALAATVIDTTPQANGTICCSGSGSSIATFGQFITVPADDTQLDSFTFFMSTNTAVMRGEVYAWDGEKATGPNLYESALRTVSNTSGFEEVTFHTGGVQLVPGQQYVLFTTVSKDYESIPSGSSASWLGVHSGSGDTYPGGSHVRMDNGSSFDQLFTNAWNLQYFDWDLAFKAVFSSSDSPTTKEDCKKGGYAKYGFKNRGECIKAVNHATPADTTAPEIQITDGPAEGSVSNEGQFFISSNEPVQFYYDIREATYTGQPTYSTLGNPNSTEVDIGLTLSNADGKEMVLYIKAVDAAGNTTEIQRRWTVDITGPTVQFTGGPSEGEVLTNNDVTFSWTTSDPAPGSGVDQVLGCMNFIPEPGGHENYGTCRTSSPTTYTDMPDGNYQFILAATDRAGNQGEAIVRNFTVDTTP